MNYTIKLQLTPFDGTTFKPEVIVVMGVVDETWDKPEYRNDKDILKQLNLSDEYTILEINEVESIHQLGADIHKTLEEAEDIAETLTGLIHSIKESL